MRRVGRLRNLYESAFVELTQNEESLQDFLRFASSIYKYSFNNMLLIYSQNPKASIVEEISGDALQSTTAEFGLETTSSPVSDHLLPPPSESKANVAVPVASFFTASNYSFDSSRSPYVSGPRSKYKHNTEAIKRRENHRSRFKLQPCTP